MSTNIIDFTYQISDFRVIEIDGEAWFPAKDVCRILGLGNVGQAIISLDKGEKSHAQTDTPGGKQKTSIISESGLYSLILRSRKPDARKFKRWVTHVVIPAVRKRNMYATSQAIEDMLANPDAMIAALTALKEERAKEAV